MIEYKQRLLDFKKSILEEYLQKCTLDQRTFFSQVYVDGVPDNKLDDAIELCQRTIKKNIKLGRTAS